MTERKADPITQKRKYDPDPDRWLLLGIEPTVRTPGISSQHISVALPPDLIEELDNIRFKYKWEYPELFAYRASFVEGAVQYFINTLKERELISDA